MTYPLACPKSHHLKRGKGESQHKEDFSGMEACEQSSGDKCTLCGLWWDHFAGEKNAHAVKRALI